MNVKGQVLMVAGEPSGDLHAAHVAKALKGICPELKLFGMGGMHMGEAGVELLVEISGVSVVGILEVLYHIKAVLRARRRLLRAIQERKPTLAILVDFPDFNLWLARALKKLGVPILYYIAPQAWAWRRGRVRLMAELVERLAVILPFEQEFFQAGGVAAKYVGHPLLEQISQEGSREQAMEVLGLDPETQVLGLLPGSRSKEVERILPVMLEAAEILTKRIPGLTTVVALSPALEPEPVRSRAEEIFPGAKLIQGRTHAVLRASTVAAVASGTATLEAALLGVPMVVVYRASWVSYVLARALVRVNHVSLVNILAGREVVPELIQRDLSAQRLARELLDLLGDSSRRSLMQEAMASLAHELGAQRASLNVAGMAAEMLGGRLLGVSLGSGQGVKE
jgi:lipid-A-disaccharide synthase